MLFMVGELKRKVKLVSNEGIENRNFCIVLGCLLVASIFILNLLFKKYSVDSNLQVYLLCIYLLPFLTTILFLRYKKQKIKLTLKETIKEIIVIVVILAAVYFLINILFVKYFVNLSGQVYLLPIYLFMFLVSIFFLSIRFSLIADIGKEHIDYKRLVMISVIISILSTGIYYIFKSYNLSYDLLGFVYIGGSYILIPIVIGRLWYSKKSTKM